MNKIKVGVLGATGSVGQRFVQLLADHPWFELTAVAGSDRSAGNGSVPSLAALDNIIPFIYVLLSHNTIRGADGASVLNAELMMARGMLDRFLS